MFDGEIAGYGGLSSGYFSVTVFCSGMRSLFNKKYNNCCDDEQNNQDADCYPEPDIGTGELRWYYYLFS